MISFTLVTLCLIVTLLNLGFFIFRFFWERAASKKQIKDHTAILQASEERIAQLFKTMELNRKEFLERNETIKKLMRERDGGQ